MANPARDEADVNLCELCSHIEKFFFCAPQISTEPKKWYNGLCGPNYHEPPNDLVVSASRGCHLCNVFLEGYLHAQLRLNEKHYASIGDVKEYLLAQEYFAVRNLNGDEISRTNCNFRLTLQRESFLVRDSELNNYATVSGSFH
jgi:hypothetical protein